MASKYFLKKIPWIRKCLKIVFLISWIKNGPQIFLNNYPETKITFKIFLKKTHHFPSTSFIDSPYYEGPLVDGKLVRYRQLNRTKERRSACKTVFFLQNALKIVRRGILHVSHTKMWLINLCFKPPVSFLEKPESKTTFFTSWI